MIRATFLRSRYGLLRRLRFAGIVLALFAGLIHGPGRAQSMPDNAQLTVRGADEALIEKGRALFIGLGCGACHRRAKIPGAVGEIGPALDRFSARAYLAGGLPNRPDNLLRWLLDPPAVSPQTAMPNMQLGQEQARALAAWLYARP